jgi:hypothetical protein
MQRILAELRFRKPKSLPRSEGEGIVTFIGSVTIVSNAFKSLDTATAEPYESMKYQLESAAGLPTVRQRL